MKIHIPLWILFFCAVLFLAKDVAAQDSLHEKNLFDGIKVQMISVAQENNRLAEENKALKAQLISLQLEVERNEQYIGAMDPDFGKERETSRKFKESRQERYDPEEDALIQEAQNIYISGQWINSDATQKLRELQLYDLQYEKQELKLDLKLLEFYHEKVKKKRGPELDGLDQDIKINQANLNELSVRIAEQEKAAMVYPQRIELLKMENIALRKKIKQLRKMLK